MTYKIIAVSRYGREVVDTAKTLKEARELEREYQMAFGSEFTIIIK
mgnify:FL=1|jgi:hypothetical protein